MCYTQFCVATTGHITQSFRTHKHRRIAHQRNRKKREQTLEKTVFYEANKLPAGVNEDNIRKSEKQMRVLWRNSSLPLEIASSMKYLSSSTADRQLTKHDEVWWIGENAEDPLSTQSRQTESGEVKSFKWDTQQTNLSPNRLPAVATQSAWREGSTSTIALARVHG